MPITPETDERARRRITADAIREAWDNKGFEPTEVEDGLLELAIHSVREGPGAVEAVGPMGLLKDIRVALVLAILSLTIFVLLFPEDCSADHHFPDDNKGYRILGNRVDNPLTGFPSELAHVADSVTTFIGVAGGTASEVNPILAPVVGTGWGDLLVLAAKLGLIQLALTTNPHDGTCQITYSILGGMGAAAAGNNVLVLAGVGGLPWTLAAGVALGAGYGLLVHDYLADAICRDFHQVTE